MASPRPNFLTPEGGSPVPSEGRILDRKMESRGLSTSFSSNLARKRPSPKKTTPSSGKSVREMANFFEKGKGPESISSGRSARNVEIPAQKRDVSAESTAATAGSGITDATDETDETDETKDTDARTGVLTWAGSSSFKSSTPPRSPDLERVFPRRVLFAPRPIVVASRSRDEHQAEENSLTLLNYKAYFNNRPLGRCLDHLDKQAAEPAKDRAAPPAEKKPDPKTKKKKTKYHLTSSATLQMILAASSPVERLDKLMESLQALDLEASYDKAEAKADAEVKVEAEAEYTEEETLKPSNPEIREGRRDAGAVNAF